MPDEETRFLRRCKKCGYEWTYKGSRRYFCCPSCMTSGQHPLATVIIE